MKKCDFCPNSILVHGELKCPYYCCILSSIQLQKILDAISKVKK